MVENTGFIKKPIKISKSELDIALGQMDAYVTDFETETDFKGDLVMYSRTPEFRERMKSLSMMEKDYVQLMLSGNGILFLRSRPGVGKSAIGKSIARKLGLRYFDIRLALSDETDLQFPNLVYYEGIGCHVIEHAVPMWAVLANQKPSLVHFEELNRAPLPVRNAALQIFLERGIGPLFKFNRNIIMMASGNIGEADGTDVEEFDSALNNRIIHVDHVLTIEDWLSWGRGKVHPDILDFIELRGSESFMTSLTENDSINAFATPRTWHMLSDYIIENFSNGVKLTDTGTIALDSKGQPISLPGGYSIDDKGNLVLDANGEPIRDFGKQEQYYPSLSRNLMSFIGTKAATSFLRFLNERVQFNLRDVLERFNVIKKDIADFRSDRFAEIITEAKAVDILQWTPKNVNNFIEFLKMCQPELRVSYFTDLLDHVNSRFDLGVKEPVVTKILRSFIDDMQRVSGNNSFINGSKSK